MWMWMCLNVQSVAFYTEGFLRNEFVFGFSIGHRFTIICFCWLLILQLNYTPQECHRF